MPALLLNSYLNKYSQFGSAIFKGEFSVNVALLLRREKPGDISRK